jgi:demethylmenaquinone methyltransferase/2-methoxy-6-polyprenyl-1,4-benzoquinol methylase
MPRIGGLLTGNQDAYEYLPETAAAFPCGEQFLEILKRVGFHNPKLTRYTFGIAYGYCGVKQ